MDFFNFRDSVAKFTLLSFAALLLPTAPAFQETLPSQNQPAESSIPARHDSIDVTEHSTPEEIEEGRLNDLYELVAQIQRKGSCTPEIIQRYQSEVLPLVEKSTAKVPRNKFLFLANRDIGDCYLVQQKFKEAEAAFQSILQYASVWPGTDDSAYPITFRQIATAEMGQQKWAEAEQSLLKSIALFEPQIVRAEKRDADLHAWFSANYRGSQSRSYALLAVVYFREGHIENALDTVEKAYDEVTKYNLAPSYRSEVEEIGKAIANASGNAAAQKAWAQRGAAK